MPFAEHDGVRICYETEGSGPPLVLHIGFMGALEDWADAGYVDALRDRYRLILIDPRGQVGSDKPHDLAAYAESNRVGDVLAVLDAEGIERAHFWGYSLGGWVGFTLGATAPHRLRSLIVGGADPFRRVDRDLDSDPFILALRKGVHTLVTEFEADDPNYWVSPGERQRWLASDAAALIAARTQWLSEPNMTEDAVAAIQTRTLIYIGSDDRPAGAERTAHLMTRATFVLLDSLDHAAGFGRTDLVLPRVEQFLAENVGDSNGSGWNRRVLRNNRCDVRAGEAAFPRAIVDDPRQRARRAGADPAADRQDHWDDAAGGGRQERFVGHLQVVRRHIALGCGNAQLGRDLELPLPRDPLQNAADRDVEPAAADEEEVRPRFSVRWPCSSSITTSSASALVSSSFAK